MKLGCGCKIGLVKGTIMVVVLKRGNWKFWDKLHAKWAIPSGRHVNRLECDSCA